MEDIYTGWGLYHGRKCLMVEDRGDTVLAKFGADGPVAEIPVEDFDPITDLECARLEEQ